MHYSKSTASLSIRHRLVIGFTAIILMLLFAGTVTLVRMNAIKGVATELINTDMPLYDSITDLYIHAYQMQAALYNSMLTHDPKYETEINQVKNDIMTLQEKIESYSKNRVGIDFRKNWQEAKNMLEKLYAIDVKKIGLNDSNGTVNLMITQINPILYRLFDHIDGSLDAEGNRAGGLLTIELRQLQKNSNVVLNAVDTIEFVEYVLIAVSLLLSLIIVFYTTKSILSYVNLIRAYSCRIASGDLTQRIDVDTQDEMGLLCQDLNVMTESLVKMTKLINESSHNMIVSLSEVRQSANLQASGASEQAASINEVTSSLAEIEKSTTQTNEKAKALGETAERTRAKGQQGLEAIEQSIDGMKMVHSKVQLIAQTILDLSNQTQQVGEITSVVNNLAQQSKMLALNASIEAVKAGEAGKGFAVVANEVKNLAEQSERSTVQVQKILENIRHTAEKAVMVTEEGTKCVDDGTNLVEQTGNIVKNLAEVIYETSIASQQIEAAIRQETVGIEQITVGMNEINQVTASFVDSTKQTTEAIENLSKIAQNIKEYIDIYKV